MKMGVTKTLKKVPKVGTALVDTMRKTKSSIKQLLALGPIPADSEMSDELFEKYDKLLNFSQPLSYDDAAQLTGLFSPDCDGLNWAILKAIEEACDTSEELMSLADKCTSEEYAALLRSRADISGTQEE